MNNFTLSFEVLSTKTTNEAPQSGLILLIPIFLGYQTFLIWLYLFLKGKPILKKTIRDELFQQFCIVHLPTNSLRKLLVRS